MFLFSLNSVLQLLVLGKEYQLTRAALMIQAARRLQLARPGKGIDRLVQITILAPKRDAGSGVECLKKCLDLTAFSSCSILDAAPFWQAARMCTRAVPRKKIRDKLEAERQERRRQKAIEKASCMPHYATACSGREKLQAKIERRLKAMEEKRRN